jgi:serine/threonine protein phosphatase PrpC
MKALRLTRDHCPNTPREIDRVVKCGGRVIRGRVNGQLAVSRAMGDHALKRSGVSAVPHQTKVPLTKDHKFAIIACDGNKISTYQ